MCSSEEVIVFLVIFNRILNLIRIVAPILLMITLAIDFIRGVSNPDDKNLKKRINNKLLATFILFAIPTLARATIYIVTNNSSCLEEEQIYQINEHYNPFQNVEYIEVDPDRKRTKIIQDPSDYEKGTPKSGISSPTVGAVSDGNAIYFLNVGASTDAFIIQDGDHFGLIDTSVKGKGQFIVNQLKILGVKELDFLLITHSHSDHVGGYNTVMSNIPVKTLIIKTDGALYPAHESTYSNIIKTAQSKGTSVCNGNSPPCQNFNLGNINFKLYNTSFFSASSVSSNNRGRFDNVNSLCAVATINGRRIYFSGDIGNYFGKNQESIVAKQIGDIDIYKVAHHGYVSFNNHQDALNALKAEYAVVTNTRGPAATAISRVKKSNSNFIKTYYTPEGTVTLTISTSGEIQFKQ